MGAHDDEDQAEDAAVEGWPGSATPKWFMYSGCSAWAHIRGWQGEICHRCQRWRRIRIHNRSSGRGHSFSLTFRLSRHCHRIPVLRGSWRDLSTISGDSNPKSRADPK